jgi:pimeloyl-ACP methyl ester carboxylesterase
MEKEVQLEDLVRTAAPHFAYQLQFASGELEKVIQSEDDIRQFLLALYGGRNDRGEVGFDAHHGVLVDRLGGLKRSKLLAEDEVEFYVREFGRSGVRGPRMISLFFSFCDVVELLMVAVNWYRTRQINYRDELAILDRKIEVPTLFIQALRDQALPPHLGKSMAKHLPSLTVKQVNTSHWALWEKPQEVNEIIEGWLREKAFTEARAEKL